MVNPAMFSSEKHDRETPYDFWAELDREFSFTLDAAANVNNTRCAKWFGPGGIREDALSPEPWPSNEVIWLNPPYARGLQEKFIEKAWETGRAGGLVVCLLPSRTDTQVFHQYIWDEIHHKPRRGVQLRFVCGRLKFDDEPNGAPFPSMVVIFGISRARGWVSF